PSKRIAALHRLPIRSVWAARCALRCAPMAARSLRHLIRDATLVPTGGSGRSVIKMTPHAHRLARHAAHFLLDKKPRHPGR
ncbi:hypothetical protein D8B32_27065, partial [Verminephrobacter eiseniae]|nr:hypothetical protein [Verminephrobacter eiseniae]